MNFCLENEMSKDLLPPVILLRKQESMSLLLSWIPAYAEILLRVIILQLVCLLSVNRGEVIVVTPEMSN
jgi:hypothetical protein